MAAPTHETQQRLKTKGYAPRNFGFRVLQRMRKTRHWGGGEPLTEYTEPVLTSFYPVVGEKKEERKTIGCRKLTRIACTFTPSERGFIRFASILRTHCPAAAAALADIVQLTSSVDRRCGISYVFFFFFLFMTDGRLAAQRQIGTAGEATRDNNQVIT